MELAIFFRWTGSTEDLLRDFFAPRLKTTLADSAGTEYSPVIPKWSPMQPVPEETYNLMRNYESWIETKGRDPSSKLIWRRRQWCPLPEVVLDALGSFEPESQLYYFWSGHGDAGCLSRLWIKKLQTVFRRAQIVNGHSHRLRDTFAVELLLAGVPMERVSILLGHSSIKVTQKHYSPWVKARQEQLEADVRRSWSGDAPTAGKQPAKVVSIKG